MSIRVAMAQMNCLVGDTAGNAGRVVEAMARADAVGAQLLVVPELAITGYPPEDLVLRRDFQEAVAAAVRCVVRASRRYPRLATAFGYPERHGKNLHNSAMLAGNGKVIANCRKMMLPNYGVFDERRYFVPGARGTCVKIAGMRVALTICEDLWVKDGAAAREVRRARPDLILNLSASPYEAGKLGKRERLMGAYARRSKAWLIYLNLVGGQDELVFDGQSLVCNPKGRVTYRGRAMGEEFTVLDLPPGGFGAPRAPLPADEEIYGALVLGIRDYALKNGFKGAVLGLSGGVDSSLTAALAVDALGPGNVVGVRMPTRFTSRASNDDAAILARALGIGLIDLPVEPMFKAFLRALGKEAKGHEADLLRQNIQPRIRGTLLMALANRHPWLVLTTGNKSESSVGYATLYGDMAGGLSPLKDVPKALVYRLARWRNRKGKVIPGRVLIKAPTAELKPGQKDSDSLPVYPILDPILEAYVEKQVPLGEIARRGFPAGTVKRVARMVELNEFKRRQAPPGIKVLSRAFGRDRRMPITHKFRPWSDE
jgi:NAD+ synthase (glutamine-hydrolysing)